jgi:tetratricopeptide (TPR) repeat protein
MECYDKAIELDPQYADAWSGKASSLLAQSRTEEAIKCFDKAFELDPKNQTLCEYNKAIAIESLGRYDEALMCAETLMKIFPGDYRPWFRKYHILNAAGRITEANAALAKAKVLGYKG